MSSRRAFISGTGAVAALALGLACSAGGESDIGPGAGAGGSAGGASNGGTAGVIIVGTGGTAGGGTLEGCASDSYTGELVPVGMYLLLDHSGSMSSGLDEDAGTGPSKWDQVTSAITEFMSLPGTTGISMGLGFFPVPPSVKPKVDCVKGTDCLPYGEECIFKKCMDAMGATDSCISDDYRKFAVGIAPLPGVSADINAAMASQGPEGQTPMTPAMRGTMDTMLEWAGQNTDQISLVVLATDGMPTGCVPNEVSDVAAVAEGGAANGVKTFVIGIGSELTALNAIAQKGGTTEAFVIGTGNVGAEFLNALNAIRGAVGCTYKIPNPPSGEPDPTKVNVAFTPEGGTQEVHPKVQGESDCKGDKGWYYDDADHPKQIILCPASCDEVQNVKGQVDVVLGCTTIPK